MTDAELKLLDRMIQALRAFRGDQVQLDRRLARIEKVLGMLLHEAAPSKLMPGMPVTKKPIAKSPL